MGDEIKKSNQSIGGLSIGGLMTQGGNIVANHKADPEAPSGPADLVEQYVDSVSTLVKNTDEFVDEVVAENVNTFKGLLCKYQDNVKGMIGFFAEPDEMLDLRGICSVPDPDIDFECSSSDDGINKLLSMLANTFMGHDDDTFSHNNGRAMCREKKKAPQPNLSIPKSKNYC